MIIYRRRVGIHYRYLLDLSLVLTKTTGVAVRSSTNIPNVKPPPEHSKYSRGTKAKPTVINVIVTEQKQCEAELYYLSPPWFLALRILHCFIKESLRSSHVLWT